MSEHKLRRQDRALSESDSLDLLRAERVGRLAMADQDGQPYVIPLNHLLLDRTIYFHCALSGRKLDLIQQNPQVCYEVDRMLGIKSGPTACDYGAFFESAIAFGTAHLVNDAEEKASILNALTVHHADQDAEFLPVTAAMATKVAVVAIEISQISGKSRPRA